MKEECEAHGLAQYGTTDELRERLKQHLNKVKHKVRIPKNIGSFFNNLLIKKDGGSSSGGSGGGGGGGSGGGEEQQQQQQQQQQQ